MRDPWLVLRFSGAVRCPPAQRGGAAVAMRRGPEPPIEGEQPLEVGADVELLGNAHGAVKLHRLFGDETRAFADLGLGARGGTTAIGGGGARPARGPQRERN